MREYTKPVDNGAASTHHGAMTALFWIVVLMPAGLGLVALWVERSRLARRPA